ncbi:heme-binding protein [Motiliproteus sp. MSK22-1]|uniref:GlcG/HbpS family heme-binding protein n=1 Tax=Motiliproteus sp. MSK22-1 TaxID=1897630 RepID=UPI0009755C41|nr:heme-binding protein [Motiliproteus sp. MSK22-1]OMH29200.1 DNA polymerase III subunit delta' [Motiliproteus sp. MSK22-1]
MKMIPKLMLADAQIIMQGCIQKAEEIDVDMDIAITDDSGHLLMFHRMDNGRITSIDISIGKSFTAAAARKSTRAYGEVSVPGKPAFGINTSNQGKFSIVAGGLPLFVNEQIVGGIGCSSGTPDQDEIVAQAGVDAFLTHIS